MDQERLVFGALEVSEGLFGCCKYLFVFFLLLEYMFDTRTCDLNFFSIERFL